MSLLHYLQSVRLYSLEGFFVKWAVIVAYLLRRQREFKKYISDRIYQNMPTDSLERVPAATSALTIPPGQEICPSCMQVAWAYQAGCHINTEPSNKVQQVSKVPSNK